MNKTSPAQKLSEFRKRLEEKWLPEFCWSRGRPKESFVQASLVLSEYDAGEFLRGVENAVVQTDGNGTFLAARSKAKEQIFWEGRRDKNPQPLTLWLEPIITMGAVARLHLDLGWPKELLGMQSRGWEFDLVAYHPGKDSDEYIVGEVKKSEKELQVLLHHMIAFCDDPSIPIEALSNRERNAHRKYVALRRGTAAYFWAVGPNGASRAFRVNRLAHRGIRLVEVGPDMLHFARLQ